MGSVAVVDPEGSHSTIVYYLLACMNLGLSCAMYQALSNIVSTPPHT